MKQLSKHGKIRHICILTSIILLGIFAFGSAATFSYNRYMGLTPMDYTALWQSLVAFSLMITLLFIDVNKEK